MQKNSAKAVILCGLRMKSLVRLTISAARVSWKISMLGPKTGSDLSKRCLRVPNLLKPCLGDHSHLRFEPSYLYCAMQGLPKGAFALPMIEGYCSMSVLSKVV